MFARWELSTFGPIEQIESQVCSVEEKDLETKNLEYKFKFIK